MNDPTTTIARSLTAQMGSMPPAERRAARALLADYPALGLQPISRFAQVARTSHPTVLRLIARLGFDSYGAFHDALRSEVATRFKTLPSRYDAFAAAPGPKGDINRYGAAVGKNLERTLAMTHTSDVEGASALLADHRRRVFVLSAATTGPLASALCNTLRLSRPNVHAFGSGAASDVEIIDIARNDVLVVFSMPRYDAAVLSQAEAIARRGARIILFTDESLSPLSSLADHVFASVASAPSPLDSYIACLLQVEILGVALITRAGSEFRDRMKALEALQGELAARPGPESSGKSGGRGRRKAP